MAVKFATLVVGSIQQICGVGWICGNRKEGHSGQQANVGRIPVSQTSK